MMRHISVPYMQNLTSLFIKHKKHTHIKKATCLRKFSEPNGFILPLGLIHKGPIICFPLVKPSDPTHAPRATNKHSPHAVITLISTSAYLYSS